MFGCNVSAHNVGSVRLKILEYSTHALSRSHNSLMRIIVGGGSGVFGCGISIVAFPVFKTLLLNVVRTGNDKAAHCSRVLIVAYSGIGAHRRVKVNISVGSAKGRPFAIPCFAAFGLIEWAEFVVCAGAQIAQGTSHYTIYNGAVSLRAWHKVGRVIASPFKSCVSLLIVNIGSGAYQCHSV